MYCDIFLALRIVKSPFLLRRVFTRSGRVRQDGLEVGQAFQPDARYGRHLPQHATFLWPAERRNVNCQGLETRALVDERIAVRLESLSYTAGNAPSNSPTSPSSSNRQHRSRIFCDLAASSRPAAMRRNLASTSESVMG